MEDETVAAAAARYSKLHDEWRQVMPLPGASLSIPPGTFYLAAARSGFTRTVSLCRHSPLSLSLSLSLAPSLSLPLSNLQTSLYAPF